MPCLNNLEKGFNKLLYFKHFSIGMADKPVNNPGNSVYTCTNIDPPNLQNDLNTVEGNLSDVIKGYPTELQHPLFRTSNNTYGSIGPILRLLPSTYHGRSAKFSTHLNRSGMYRNKSFNTELDKSNV